MERRKFKSGISLSKERLEKMDLGTALKSKKRNHLAVKTGSNKWELFKYYSLYGSYTVIATKSNKEIARFGWFWLNNYPFTAEDLK